MAGFQQQANSALPAEMKGGRTPPGPRGHWLWGCWPRLRTDPLGLYYDAWREFGGCVRIRFLPGIHGYLLTDPEAVEHVLQKQHKNYRKPAFFTRIIRLLLGEGLFTSEGEFCVGTAGSCSRCSIGSTWPSTADTWSQRPNNAFGNGNGPARSPW
jgi:hypothetical protein